MATEEWEQRNSLGLMGLTQAWLIKGCLGYRETDLRQGGWQQCLSLSIEKGAVFARSTHTEES